MSSNAIKTLGKVVKLIEKAVQEGQKETISIKENIRDLEIDLQAVDKATKLATKLEKMFND